jgi:arylsulfatase
MSTRRILSLTVAAAVVAGILGVLAVVRQAGHPAPSIILVSVDTLRPDHLGCYGYPKKTSPAVDAFARDAILFENCFSQAPTTRPSCASFLSGFLPHECKVFTNSDNIPPEVPMVAEQLKAKGYRTLGVSSNFVLGQGTGYDRGFDVFDNRLDEAELVRKVPERLAAKTTDAAISLLRADGRKGKFFMWIHYQDPHGPYTPPPPFDTAFLRSGREIRRLEFNSTFSGIGGIPSYQRIGDEDDFDFYAGRYDGEIGYFDAHFGRLLKALRDMDLYDNSLIIFTADHGEGMGERDYFFAHGEYVYNNLIRVPLLVRSAESTPVTRSEYVELLDLAPTILRFAGIEPDPKLRGRDLLGGDLKPAAIFSEMEGKYSIIEDGMKLIIHADPGEFLLFDLGDDPGEQHDLSAEANYARYVEPLKRTLSDFFRQDRIGAAVRTPANLSEEDKEKLKSLGYIH